jgi:hypothetical protein
MVIAPDAGDSDELPTFPATSLPSRLDFTSGRLLPTHF